MKYIAFCGLACCVCSENKGCVGCQDGGCESHGWCKNYNCCKGDQFPIVIIPITNYHSVLLNRNLLYTAMTRAKHKLIFVGDREALEYAIRNLQGLKRNTALCERLKKTEQKAA